MKNKKIFFIALVIVLTLVVGAIYYSNSQETEIDGPKTVFTGEVINLRQPIEPIVEEPVYNNEE